MAAISTAGFASNDRSYELRESPTYPGKYSEKLMDQATRVDAIAVAMDDNSLTSFERLKKISEENDQSGRQ